jgi:hypothetical protein
LTDRGTPDQRAEYTALDDEFISNYEAWERIKAFVDVELPVRTLLRVSDGHQLNLPDICYGFEEAKSEGLVAVAAAEARFPEKYAQLGVRVTAAFEKRVKYVVTHLCLAACMVLPKHVYTLV